MRQDYQAFVQREAEILVVGPDGPRAFQRYWAENGLPFVGLADPKHTVADLYGQQVKLLKLGRMPAVVVIDKAGRLRFRHDGDSMRDIPPNRVILELLDQLNRESGALTRAPLRDGDADP